MSVKSQQSNMKSINNLISQGLGYNYEAKKKFLSKSAAFLRVLGKDLHFTEMRVNTNEAGIAVSGEVTLYGMWSDDNGLMLQIAEPLFQPYTFMYRHITNIKDYRGGQNQWLPCSWFVEKDYDRLLQNLLLLKVPQAVSKDAA